MKFKSKTALSEHFKELELGGYIIGDWITKDNKSFDRMYKINFKQIDEDDKKLSKEVSYG